MTSFFRSAFAVIILFGLTLSGQSQTTWNANFPNWNDASSWSSGIPTATTATIFNEPTIGTNFTVTVGTATAQSITFQDAGASAFTFNNGTLALGASGGTSFIEIQALVNDVQTFSSSTPITFSGATSFALTNNGTSTSRIQINGAMTNGAVNLNVNGTQAVTIDGVIGNGSGGITKSNSGTLTLNGANTFTGAVSITGGTVILGNANALGTAAGTTTINGGVLNLGGQTVGSEAISMTGSGFGGNGVIINSTGTGTLNGTITMTGASTIGAGNITLGGAVNGAFALTKIGTGTLTFSGASGFNGGLNVQNGSVALTTANNRIATTNVVTLGSGSTSGRLVLGSGAVGISQTIAGLTTSGTGTTNAVVGGASVVSTLAVNTSGTSTYNGSLGGAGANENNLALTKQGTGTFVLGGASTLTGAVTVENGALQLTSNTALPTNANVILGSGATSGLLVLGTGAAPVTISLPNVNQSGSGTTNAVVGGATLNSTLTVPVSSGSVTFGTTLGGSGANQNNLNLVKSGTGTLILNQANSYTGTTTVSAGTLTISNTTGSATGTGITTIASTATLNGTGIGGSTIVNGTIAPGNSIGTINFAAGSAQTWGQNGTYSFEYGQNLVSNAGEGTTHDFIASAGTLDITATTTAGQQFNLNLIYTGPDQPVPPTVTIRIAQFTGGITNFDAAKFNITGQFSAASVPVIAVDGSNFVTLTFTPVPEPVTILGLTAAGAFAISRFRRRQSRQLNG